MVEPTVPEIVRTTTGNIANCLLPSRRIADYLPSVSGADAAHQKPSSGIPGVAAEAEDDHHGPVQSVSESNSVIDDRDL